MSHPAVRWAARHPDGAVPPRRRSRSRPNPIGRSLGSHLDQGFRPDIEGLRALAVIAVVVYHARLLGLHGGFVGVDVFFVVSGYLITRLILGELAKTGRLSLAAFWGRRARRLLAASALVVAVTALGAHLLLPPLTQRSVVTDVVAAATFTSNIVFADQLGSYFGAQLGQSTPSPLLHYWSLAVEEQFYLCWPLLLALLTRRPRQYRRLLLATIATVGVLGFVLAAWMTPRAPSWAFFLLPTRMGELLAGALLAVVGLQVRVIPRRHPRRARVVRPGRDRRRLRAFRCVDAVARYRRPRAGAGDDGGHRRRISDTVPVVAGARPARQRSRSGSDGTRTRSTSGTGQCSCWPRPAGARWAGPSGSSRWPWRSGFRRCRSGSSRIRSATPAG